MTPGERQASGGLSATVSAHPPHGGPAAHSAPSRPEPSQANGSPRASLWEDVFRSASPTQQMELLSLASRQGLLYAHQLPRTGNGTRPQAASDDVRGLQALSRLLQGQIADLEPSRGAPVAVVDPALDARQREAVARALATPDVYLIQGLPGTGKSRVVAEIVTQAAARGDRVLLVADGAAAVDRVLEFVDGRDVLCPIRCLGQGERAADLAAAARAATFPERVRALKENALTAAVRTREQAEQRCQQLRKEDSVWPRLLEMARRQRELEEETGAVQARREGTPPQLEQAVARLDETSGEEPADEFFAGLRKTAGRYREELARLDAERAEAEGKQTERKEELDALAAQRDALAPLADAKNHGRWWSPTWWRATFSGDAPGKLTALQGQLETARDAHAELGKQLEDLAARRQALDDNYHKEQQQQLAEEIARRVAELDGQLATLDAKAHVLRDDWQKACAALELEKLRPAEISEDAVRVAHELWKGQQQEDEQRCTFARQWATYLEESADGLAARLPGYANLVATPTAALATDPHFSDPAAAGGQFDLLVLEEAETVTEAELLRLARRARRWILVGEPGLVAATANRGTESNRTRSRPKATASPSALTRANAFHRLWTTLHCDPTRLPYIWAREGERLCCRLRELAAEQRQWLESERVADFPEIELRILALPRLRPQLAEVLFPPTMTIEQAKGYIFQELQELPVQAAERCLSWADEPDRLSLCLCPAATGREAAVALEPGVREVVTTAGEGGAQAVWVTSRLEFESGAGWDRRRAEDWLQTHLGLRDLGRTGLLETPHRMTPELAAVVSDLLFEGGYRPHCGAAAAAPGPAVEFVAVPSLSRKKDAGPPPREQDRRRREGGSSRTATAPPQAGPPPRGGAGLEQDLAVARHGDRLPTEMRGELPRQGLVNYLEAQAVVRKLEELATEKTQARGAVAVIALYPAQGELIRHLIGRSAKLAGGSLSVEVGAPEAFRQREYDVALVSLTRSHTHRAVPYGDEAHWLGLALTRARARLIVFGDAGTLARRTQWEGILDHLDEAAAAREGRVLGQLLGYLQGRGRHGRAFRLSEGGGP